MAKSTICILLFALFLFTVNAESISTKLDRIEPKPGAKLIVTSSNGLHCRAKPCNGKIVKTMPANTVVSYAGKSVRTCGHLWYLVKGSGFQGWSASTYLKAHSGGGGGSQCRQGRNYPLYKQCDRRWGNDKLGSSSTVCKVGCLITSVAMALKGLGKKINGATATPKNFNAFLRANRGYQGNLFIWGSVARFGLKYQGQIRDIAGIKRAVCAKKIVSLNIDRGGHWVLAVGVNSNGSFQILDPGRTRSTVPANQVLRAGIYNV
eukprot:gene9716-1921_t